MNELKKRLLEVAYKEYPVSAILEYDQNNRIKNFAEYENKNIILALKKLHNDGLIENGIYITSDNLVKITGDLRMTELGYNLFR